MNATRIWIETDVYVLHPITIIIDNGIVGSITIIAYENVRYQSQPNKCKRFTLRFMLPISCSETGIGQIYCQQTKSIHFFFEWIDLSFMQVNKSKVSFITIHVFLEFVTMVDYIVESHQMLCSRLGIFFDIINDDVFIYYNQFYRATT